MSMNLQALALRNGGDERRAYFASAEAGDAQASAALVEALLSEAELARFAKLSFPLKQQGFLLGRLAAKRALSALLAEPDLCRIEIRSGVFGQPLVYHPRSVGVEVSLSHSHGLAVALAYPGEFPLGMDVETVSADSADAVLAELQISDAEKAWLAAQALAPTVACGVLWTAREALGKSMKIGLNCPLGTLALDRIEPAGAAAWIGQYANFPQSRCLSQQSGGRILSIAIPRTVEVMTWPLVF